MRIVTIANMPSWHSTCLLTLYFLCYLRVQDAHLIDTGLLCNIFFSGSVAVSCRTGKWQNKIMAAMAVSRLLPSICLLLAFPCCHVGPSSQHLSLLWRTPNWSCLASSLAPFSWRSTQRPGDSTITQVEQGHSSAHNLLVPLREETAVITVACKVLHHLPAPTPLRFSGLISCFLFGHSVPWFVLFFQPLGGALSLCSLSPLCVFSGTWRIGLVPSPSWGLY